jgi:uncharacterized membrane protein YeiH
MRLLDWLGTIIFAVSGSLAAAASGLDLLGSTLVSSPCIRIFGTLTLSFPSSGYSIAECVFAAQVGLITAVGGGTIRDLIAGAGKVGCHPFFTPLPSSTSTMAPTKCVM